MANRAYTLDNPQTLQEFLAKYKDAISPDGKFIPGKANLNYDDLDAATVFQQLMGGYTIPGYTDNGQPYEGPGTVIDPASSANADWIEDPRAKGWIAQHPKGAAITATVLGGVGASMAGLLGSGAAGTSAGSTAFGGANSFAGANAVGAGDLALGAMPQAVGAGGTFAGGGTMTGAAAAGAAGGASGGLLSSAAAELPQVTITGSKAAGSAFGSGATPSWMTGANAIGAGDLALGAMPEVTAATVGLPTGLMSNITNAASTAGKFLKDNPTLTQLGMAGLGALAGSQDTTVDKSSKNDPWAPAQPYLLENLKKNAALQEQYAQNPFSDQQKTAYQNSFNNSDNFRNNVAPGLLNMVNSFQPYQRQQTAVGGGYKPAAQTGLLSPNMQAPQGQSIGQVDWSQFLPKRA